MFPGRDEYNSFEQQLQRFEAVLDRLDGWGLRVSDSSRLHTYRVRLEEVANDPSPYVEERVADQLIFDLREIDEICEIVEAFGGSPGDMEMDRLRLLHEGHEHPDAPSADRARDAQYELYLRAILTKGGLDVALQEPDLVARFGDHSLNVAAKRPTSVRALDDRLRSATKQLDRCAGVGIVAMSLDQIVRERDHLLVVPDMAALQPAMADAVALFLLEHRNLIARRASRRPPAAILFTTRLPGRASATNHSVLGTSLHTELFAPPGSSDREAAMNLAGAIERYLE